jgi:hypothetical protein
MGAENTKWLAKEVAMETERRSEFPTVVQEGVSPSDNLYGRPGKGRIKSSAAGITS